MYINFKNHTTYSLCKGAIKINELIEKAKEYKMPAIGIMDINNLFGALEFSSICKKNSIQPILGCELTIDLEQNDNNYQHNIESSFIALPLIAKNDIGYKNLLYLASKCYIDKQQGLSPHVKFSELKKYNSGLIAFSGGLDGFLAKNLLMNQENNAIKLLKEFQDIFKDDFFIEINRHSKSQEIKIEDQLIKIALNHDIALIASNDVYFLNQNMHEAQDILNCIGEGQVLHDDSRIKKSPHQYFKSTEEMKELFRDLPDAIENSINIAKKCHIMAFERPPSLPKFSTKDGFDDGTELKKQAHGGLKEKLTLKAKIEGLSDNKIREIEKEYFERLDYELSIIIKMDFPGYFLIVSDFIKWAKNNNIPVGPGRGSGAGSVVAWALKITDLDPIRFGLLFERFLNPERVSMPDFDIDFCQARRDEVIDYVQKKYGTEYVAQIITFGKLQARAVLKDVGRVLQMPYNQVDRICKLIPFNAIEAVTLEKAIEMDEELQKAIKEDEQIKKLVDIALKLEGLNRHASTHAAGVVIGDKPLHEICCLYSDKIGEMPAVGYSMKYAEAAGLVKFDFLGLKTLTTISKTVELIKSNRNINVNISEIKLDDKKTFEMLAQGDSIGAFQIESSGMRSVLRQMRADKIEDIIALISLYRPGPMDNIPTYIKRKHGQEQISYPHPLLEPILKETYGVIVYQEQVMEIARVLAKYSLGGADLLRRAMGKKIKEEMDKQRKIFIAGAKENNVDEKQAGEIFDLVDKFAGYGFNKSHAAAYALISYQTAYLKAHFLPEFLTASINLEIDNADKINIFLQVAKNHNIQVLPPDINKSQALFSIEKIS
ncbi:DNA polymerase III subunit alpha [Rickettsiales bacterium]|nr:DNA polymerase III subunit alpha [Rickettsiales bacterium]